MKVTALRWSRPLVAIAAVGGVALTLGVAPASAAQPAQSSQTNPSTCMAAGYLAQTKVTYHRTATESYIDSVSVNVDKRAGAHNKVRIVVKDGEKTVFYYASSNTVTAGPFLFDYTDNPIPLHQTDQTDQYQADVTFDFDRSTGGTTGAAPSPDGAAPDGASSNDPDGVESGRDYSGDDGEDGDSDSPKHRKHSHSDADPASAEAPTSCTATVRF